jgi:3-hydroxybutyryl-CoA dehydrogenase
LVTQATPVGVVGAGTMGSGIATVAARAGYPTLLFDTDKRNLARGVDAVRGFLDRSARLGKMAEADAEAAKRRLVGTTTLTDFAACGFVIEAVYEQLDVKKDLLGRLDDIVAESALIHTNTSTLSVTGIASGSRRPERVIGTHYCNPAPLMALVEVASGRHTASTTHAATIEFLRSLGKTTVVTKDRPGFIVNRVLIPWENSCIAALEAGIGTRESIDTAAVSALGHPMGPFRLLDIIGLDVHLQVATRLYEQLREERFYPPPMVQRMVAAGDLGRKTGRGFYQYEDTRIFGS